LEAPFIRLHPLLLSVKRRGFGGAPILRLIGPEGPGRDQPDEGRDGLSCILSPGLHV
jgi:hypothetical protein